MVNHGVYTRYAENALSTMATAACGIPFVIGVAPLASVDEEDRAPANVPFLATSFAEAEEALGYSDNWTDYGISEFMYYHFRLAGVQPVIFLPLTETISSQQFSGDGSATEFTITAKPDTVQKVEVGGTEVTVSSYDKATGKVTLASAPASGTDNVEAFYLSKPSAATVAAAVDKIDLCMAMFGVIPDLIVAPGFSHETTVAAAMATKAAAVNGMFHAKAIVDIEAASYTAAITAKNGGTFTETEIVCWPHGKLGDMVFHGSTIEAGRLAQTDVDNEGVPYESPSNKAIFIDSLCDGDGQEVILTLEQANILNAAGICTALNFMGGYKCWGNYTGAYPASTAVEEYFIPVGRMFDWVANTLIKTFWSKLDKPITRRLLDGILDSCNIWLNGLVGRGYLLGGRAEMIADENPVTDLMAGIVRLHLFLTPPSPAQEIDFVLEYDASYVESALS